MLNKVKAIAGRAWAYALRKSEFLRFVFHGDDGNAWYDADWERE